MKKILSFSMAVIMAICSLNCVYGESVEEYDLDESEAAEDVIESGEAVENSSISLMASDTDLKYEFNGGYIYFDKNTGTVTKCKAYYTSFVIPSMINGVKVTSIGDYAFEESYDLEIITIPESVTSIGNHAFSDCNTLFSIVVDENNTEYSSYEGVLYNKNRTILIRSPEGVSHDLVIPEGAISIGDYAFENCSELKSIIIPESVTSISDYAFRGWGPRSIVVDENNTEYFSYEGVLYNKNRTILIHYSDDAPGQFIIPEGVTSISDYAFERCSGLSSITIPESVTSIGNYAFYGCSPRNIVVDESNTEYSSYEGVLYNKNKTTLIRCPEGKYDNYGEFVIPEGVTSIDDYAFFSCGNLRYITIPESVTSMGDYAFSECSRLQSITIPESVTSIGNYAFSKCSRLQSITIPGSITSMGDYVFSSCDYLINIIIPEGIANIGNYTFEDCIRLKSVTISKSVTSIGDYVFSGCSSLESITIPESVTSIGAYAFNGSGLTSITIPESMASIGDYAFYRCTSLESITIPDSVTSIGRGAFRECFNLQSITLSQNITNIEDYSFYRCLHLRSITIPEGVISIGDYAFSECNFLKSITIPESVTSISENAFRIIGEDAVIYCYKGSTADNYGLYYSGIYPEGITIGYIIKKELKGDIDGDGEISSTDATYILLHTSGTRMLTGSATEAADVNGDGEVTSTDATYILLKTAGLRDF